jgi:hypothetical protein
LREALKQAPGVMKQAKQQLEAEQDGGELMESRIDGQATIKATRDTGMTMNENPMVEFDLEVSAGGTPYEATIQQLTSRLTAAQCRPGGVLPCKVDPQDKPKVLLVNPAMAS